MYFKVLKDSALFYALCALNIRMKYCNAQARALVAELGGRSHGRKAGKLAGGIDGIEFDQKPEGWMKVYPKYHPNMFYPKEKGNRELLKRLASLPTVSDAELNEVVHYTPQWIGLTYYSRVGAEWGDEFHLIEVDTEVEYQPLPDMVEIKASEYKLLKGEIKALSELGLI